MNNNLKTLEEHDKIILEKRNPTKKGNGIACPNCGEELYDSNPMMVLTSSPSQKNIACNKCGYTGYRYC